MKRIISKIALLACLAALCLGVVFGCSAGQTTTVLTEAQQENRAYMQNVNTIMSSFETLYANMKSALETGDADTAKQCVEEASTALESLKSLTVPDALADIQAAYVAGCEKLVQAVNDYYNLYAENSDVTSSTYQDKIAQIQSLYNEGISQLQSGDTAASAKD